MGGQKASQFWRQTVHSCRYGIVLVGAGIETGMMAREAREWIIYHWLSGRLRVEL
jgi:hypothetical protein